MTFSELISQFTGLYAIVPPVFLGAILGATATHMLTRHRERVSQTLSLHSEFTTLDAWEARSEADRILNGNSKSDLRDIYLSRSPKEGAHIFFVSGFMERLSAAMNHNKVDRKLAASLFAQTYFYWEISLDARGAFQEPDHAEKQRNIEESEKTSKRCLGWRSMSNMKRLGNLFRQHAPHDMDMISIQKAAHDEWKVVCNELRVRQVTNTGTEL